MFASLLLSHNRVQPSGNLENEFPIRRFTACYAQAVPSRVRQAILEIAGPVRRALRDASYDWTREIHGSKRIIMYLGIFLQGYAV